MNEVGSPSYLSFPQAEKDLPWIWHLDQLRAFVNPEGFVLTVVLLLAPA